MSEAAPMEQVSEDVTRSCQIFSGTFFLICVGFLVALNSDSPFYTKKRSADRRLMAGLRMGTYVAIFSAFFNFFQLTELDDFALPRSTSFVLDMSRPFEWICTCPLMQAALVLMAGDTVPDYRLWMMPLLSFTVLLIGVAAVSVQNVYARIPIFCLGFCVALTMFWYNRKQIVEFSYGEEGLFRGSSEFRKLSVLLIVTWLPFPVWFFLSPEGMGLITDISVIQVGWAILNMFSKGSFLALFQRVKANHFSEMNFRMAEFSVNGEDFSKGSESKFMDKNADWDIGLHALVDDTADFLGMAAKAAKLKQLLKEARVTDCTSLDKLDELACRDAMLPWEFVFAMKRRLRARKLQGGLTRKSSPQSEGGQVHGSAEHQAHASKLVSLAAGQDVEALEAAISRAAEAGVDAPHLELGRERVQEVQRWKVVKKYLESSKGFKAAIEGCDRAGLESAIEVADAAGLKEHANMGKTNLKDLSRRQTASKAAMKRGVTLFKEQSFDAAVVAFTEAIRENPTNADAFLNRSAAYGRQKNWVDAEVDAAKALELDPTNAKNHHSRALALHNLNDQRGALAACATGLAQHPGNDPLLRLQDKVNAAIQAAQEELEQMMAPMTTQMSADADDELEEQPPTVPATIAARIAI